MVHQQIRALQIYDTAIARQKGFPQRICFQEFLRRYILNLNNIFFYFKGFFSFNYTLDTSFWHLISTKTLT